MKPLFYLFAIVSVMTMIRCTQQKRADPPTGLDLSSVDTTVAPGESFYRYATGGWQQANPIPDEYARYGSFDKLREENQVQLQELIQELVSQDNTYGTNAQKVDDMYSMGLDSLKLNNDGA